MTEAYRDDYQQATIRTAADLHTIARSMPLEKLSSLSLPEIDQITNEIARVIPAGNVPGLILSGLVRLEGRTIEPEESRKHIGLLFRGVRQSLDKAIYGAIFAGPAAILYGYQQLLRLAGKDPDMAFADGTWQFYLEFSLREDSARHTNETTGFHTALQRDNVTLNDADTLAAWMMTATNFVKTLPDLLANEWQERVIIRLLLEAAEEHHKRRVEDITKLRGEWMRQRPYQRGSDSPLSYPAYRQQIFEKFWRSYYDRLNGKARKHFDEQLAIWEQDRLPKYKHQMSWLAYLQPNQHNEQRVHYPINQAHIGVVSNGYYYVIPFANLNDIQETRRMAGAILADEPDTPKATLDDSLVRLRREHQNTVRAKLDAQAQQELDLLRHTPVLINWDIQQATQPLAYIRQGKRGIGDHPLTIFRTDESMVFDQSHIFFDGAWGAVVAEVMTNEAIITAKHIAQQARIRRHPTPPQRLTLQISGAMAKAISKQHIEHEVSAENISIRGRKIHDLRKMLKQRNDLAQITVNDLFILYRGLHARMYQPSQTLLTAIEERNTGRSATQKQAYQAAINAIGGGRSKNPAILIPIDATWYDPRERVFPTTFRNPLTEFLDHHRRTMKALQAYQADNSNESFARFEEEQLVYLRMVGGFGEILSRYKEIAMRGESTSTASIKFLAHLNGSIQTMLNNLPGRFDLLNEVIKGEEVFSNTGRVARGSTLRRFITAKDDNKQKKLAWGLITDDDDVMRLSLRDFRPHIEVLYNAGWEDIAQLIAQDYLDAFARGLNTYISELNQITVTSPQTRQNERKSIFKRLFS